MYNIKYFYDNNSKFIEIENVTFPTQFSDVMDGTWDTGSFEFVINYSDFYENINPDNKMSNFVKEGSFIKRDIIKDNIVIDETVFEIEEITTEKDSTYDSDELKITIKYTEATKFLTNLIMPNHAFTIYNYYIENTNQTTNTSLWDVLERSIKIIKERNQLEWYGETHKYPFYNIGSRFRKMNLDTINPDLKNILKSYPSKNRTYLDSNFFDICRENFNDISAVPYYNALKNELDYISSMGKETSKKINYDENKIAVSSSWNRSLSNNADLIENKAVNIYEDNEYVWYPLNVPLDNYSSSDSALTNPGNYIRPKGLNEGLEDYQYWYDWYLELPFNIERIDKLYLLKIGKKHVQGSLAEIEGNNVFVDVSDMIVEESVYQGLTQREKKYYAHYKRGSNRIENVVITAEITTVDDNWPWEKAKDNSTAFTTAFAVKYKPIINTDITVIKDPNKIKNKKNIAFATKNISDSDLASQTKYELEKNFYSQYMLEIAGEYQHIFAGELVEINGFENHGIPSKKYLIYKVDTTFDKEGSHQIIYFNEMVAKNSVLLNENNLVRISQNPSYDSIIERVFKTTDAIKIEGVLTSNKSSGSTIPGDTSSKMVFSNVMMILCPKLMGFVENTTINDMYIKGVSLSATSYDVQKNMVVPDLSYGLEEMDEFKVPKKTIRLIPTMNFFNAGTVSQVIVKSINNYIWDNIGNSTKYNLRGGEGTLASSEPYKYTDITGMCLNFQMILKNEIPTYYINGTYSGNELDANYNTYYPKDEFGDYYSYAGNMITIDYNEKDQRETFVGVYEQTFAGDDGEYSSNSCKIDLTDYFTSCTSCFMSEISNEQINIGHKLDKDILVFDKKVYNINSIDEFQAVKKIDMENYYDVISVDKYYIFIKLTDPKTNLPFIGNVGEEIDEYSFAIRGVLHSTIKNGVNVNIKKVPQIVITVPKHVVKQEEYIRIDLSAIRL